MSNVPSVQGSPVQTPIEVPDSQYQLISRMDEFLNTVTSSLNQRMDTLGDNLMSRMAEIESRFDKSPVSEPPPKIARTTLGPNTEPPVRTLYPSTPPVSSSPYVGQSHGSSSTKSTSTAPDHDYLDVTSNFGQQQPSSRSTRETLDPGEYRRATMAVNMKTDIPTFDVILQTFTPSAVLQFLEQLDYHLMKYYKTSYTKGTHTEQYIVVTQNVGTDFRNQLITLTRDPEAQHLVTDDTSWLNLSNKEFFSITRHAMQPKSDSAYANMMQVNLPCMHELKDIRYINVFNFSRRLAPLRRFFVEFLRLHTFLNLGPELDDNDVSNFFSAVPDVNDSTTGACKILKNMLSAKCGPDFGDTMVRLALSRLRLTKAQQTRRTDHNGRISKVGTRFTDTEELLKFCTQVLEEFTSLHRDLDKFNAFLRKPAYSPPTTSESTVNYLADGTEVVVLSGDSSESESPPLFILSLR